MELGVNNAVNPAAGLISPVDREWHAGGHAASAISSWEHETGLRLPDDYRGFMIRYNGGRPYPNMFKHARCPRIRESLGAFSRSAL
ncbi:SMI1/KNR4 family protein [Mesorhizobium ventifaucium]